MRLLLDTCIVYDWLMGEFHDQAGIALIRSQGALVSAVTVWEMAIKHTLGKSPLPSINIAEEIEDQGFQWLNITPYHTQAVIELHNYHKDPFDRLLIAQARQETLRIVTYDIIFKEYTDAVLLIGK